MDLTDKYNLPKPIVGTGVNPDAVKNIVSKFKPEAPSFNPFDPTSNSDADMDQQPFYTGLIYKTIRNNPELMQDPEVVDVIAKLLGFEDSNEINPIEMVDVLKKIFLTADNLKYMTCTPDEIEQILIPEAENGTQALVRLKCITI